jgi:propanol-preferring alcohol dehydrogenase
MKAMVLDQLTTLSEHSNPLRLYDDYPNPLPQKGEFLLKVLACAICHTDIDIIEGRTPPRRLPAILGHQVIGRVVECGPGADRAEIGSRVGVAWIHSSCGHCNFCIHGLENLCAEFKGTGRDVSGGYADFMTIPAESAFPIPKVFSDAEAAPLLCAGAIGWRSLSLTGLKNGQNLGLMGFGASAHLVLLLVRYLMPLVNVYVFARDAEERAFALELGAQWAGNTHDKPKVLMDVMIDTTPVWQPVLLALDRLAPGGRLVINAIRKEESDKSCLLSLDYPRQLWMEKEIKTVANVTRDDVQAFISIAAEIPIKPTVEIFSLEEANRALRDQKFHHIHGAKVFQMNHIT